MRLGPYLLWGNAMAAGTRFSRAFVKAAVSGTLAVMPSVAEAHVKWFTTTDVATPPLRPAVVLTPLFGGVLAAASLALFVGVLLGGWIAKRWPSFTSPGLKFASTEERLIRAATGAYFIFVSSHGGVILTPELRSPESWIPAVQFVAAMALIWQPTCAVAGAIILLLYGFAVDRYGIFHLTDYLFFPALAFYLISLALPRWRLVVLREPLLTGALAFSLAWTAIEKFVYPQWTYAVVATHPSIAFGLPVPFVVVVAGFVEFTLAFYLIVGRGLVRIGGAVYAMIFIAAMPSFGKLDVYGHLVIVATLVITMLRGATPFQRFWHRRQGTLMVDAAWIMALYWMALVLFFAAYYALQASVRG